MGYTSVANREDAVRAATELLAQPPATDGANELADVLARYPLAIEQVMAEAGIVEPLVCARAFAQAHGDTARAVSLVRAWSANLPRLANVRTKRSEWLVTRRITPAYGEPRGGQFLGASRDYEQRLLDFGPPTAARAAHNGAADGAHQAVEALPADLPPAVETLYGESLIAAHEAAVPTDLTRTTASRTQRGALLQFLARAETGALTSLAYAGIRGHGQRQDPTLVELRSGEVPVRVQRPGGGSFVLGSFAATLAEVALYAVHDEGEADGSFTLGVGITSGRVERRAIAAAMLDAATTRAASDTQAPLAPYDDREFIAVALDGQEASGFVEHLKLPHHVTFASDLDRVRAARDGRP